MQQGRRGKTIIKATGDEASYHGLACHQWERQEQGCSTKEDKPGARSDPNRGGHPADPGTVPQCLSRGRDGTGDELTYKVGTSSIEPPKIEQ